MTIGERLRILRNSKGKTLKKLSEDIGVNYTTLSNYERDYRIPELKTLIKLSEYYNTPIDVIVGNDRIEKKLKYEKYLRIFNKKIIPVVSLKNCEIINNKPINEKYFIDTIVITNNICADFGVKIEDKNNFPILDVEDVAIVTFDYKNIGMYNLFLFNEPHNFQYVSKCDDGNGILVRSNDNIFVSTLLFESLEDFVEHNVSGVVSAIFKREFNEVKREKYFENKRRNKFI